MSTAKEFYDREYANGTYIRRSKTEEHPFYEFLSNAIVDYNLEDKRCLEVGCGNGLFQNMVDDYTGVDITNATQHLFSKPFFACSATELPFEDNTFDAIWTYAVLEHIPDPEKALSEMRRVLKPDGILLLHAAWHCHSFAANGYSVRPYRDFNIFGKAVKTVAVIHDIVIIKILRILLNRVLIILRNLIGMQKFHYKKLVPNYETFWVSDSDAVNSMDQLEAVLWFVRHGDICVYPAAYVKRFLQVSGEVIIKIMK